MPSKCYPNTSLYTVPWLQQDPWKGYHWHPTQQPTCGSKYWQIWWKTKCSPSRQHNSPCRKCALNALMEEFLDSIPVRAVPWPAADAAAQMEALGSVSWFSFFSNDIYKSLFLVKGVTLLKPNKKHSQAPPGTGLRSQDFQSRFLFARQYSSQHGVLFF